MRWDDERYVRVYTRDTGDWLAMSFDAQGLFLLILRKADRAGILKLGKRGRAAVGPVLGHPGIAQRMEAALEELLDDGCVVMASETELLVPNFIAAQETRSTDAQRKRDQRERDRDAAVSRSSGSRPALTLEKEDESPISMSPEVTSGHQKSPAVTMSHEESPLAVPCRAVPSVPCRTKPTEPPVVVVEMPLGRALEMEFEHQRGVRFEWSHADEAAVRALLKHKREDVMRRWSIALRTSFPRCDSVRVLVQNWNSYAADQPAPPGKPKDTRKGHVRAEDMKHSEEVGDVVL